jgi:zinc transport system substrate-binding protein
MKRIFLIPLIFLLAFAACSEKTKTIYIATTIHPIAQIIKQIAPDGVDIVCLVPPGQSPHTFSLTPSEQLKLESASAIIYVSNELDGWAAKTDNKHKICLVDLLPDSLTLYFNEEHKHSDSDIEHSEHKFIKDPHFWTDPLAVKSILDTLSKMLKQIFKDNPEFNSQIAHKTVSFANELDNLHTELLLQMTTIENRPVFLFHPSMRYFLKRYRLQYMGAIETSPGKEPTPNYIAEIIEKIKSSEAKAIFSEPQLPDKIATMIAEAAAVNLIMLDPIGGLEGRVSYFDLIKFNAENIRKALE